MAIGQPFDFNLYMREMDDTCELRLTSATPEQNLGKTRYRGGFVWTTTRYADLCSNGYPEVTLLASSSSSTP